MRNATKRWTASPLRFSLMPNLKHQPHVLCTLTANFYTRLAHSWCNRSQKAHMPSRELVPTPLSTHSHTLCTSALLFSLDFPFFAYMHMAASILSITSSLVVSAFFFTLFLPRSPCLLVSLPVPIVFLSHEIPQSTLVSLSCTNVAHQNQAFT